MERGQSYRMNGLRNMSNANNNTLVLLLLACAYDSNVLEQIKGCECTDLVSFACRMGIKERSDACRMGIRSRLQNSEHVCTV